ncbi:MAG: ribosome-associated translation inhibitor RaiA [Proteobacteria bacterium]|nr:ribosome-associated translation inhibitor RaiA [Pseudomonadota bacterium]
MQTSVTFKNLDPSDNLKDYISDKLDKLDKYLDNPAEATVVFLIEKFRHIAEVNITGDRLNIYGKEETNDMYSAIDMVIDKLEIQIKKNKQKIRKRRVNHRDKSVAEGQEIGLSEESNMGQIKIRNIEYKPMDIEEAVLQMDLVNDNFLVFTNARSSKINVLYRRKDGNYGLIQPLS